MHYATAALATLLLAGCATPQSGYWDNQAHDGSNFDRDKAQCLYESAAATASAPATFSLSQNIAQDVATGVRQNDLAAMCLRARGYVWVTR
jgi:PBP1b-binding outer membrane lipoprotein LpoB